jgi:hypothetical protein
LKTRWQVLSMCFRDAALTPSMLRASMTWKSTTRHGWSAPRANAPATASASASREIDRERIGFASSKDEERSLRLMLLIVVMNQREPIKQHHRGLDGRSLRGTGRTLQLWSAIPFMSLRPDANDIPA